MVAQLAPASHPILSALTTSQEALEAVRDVQPVYMSPTEKKTAITELARLEAALVELKLRVVATADDAADLALSRDTGSWLASVTPRRFRRRAGRRPARRRTGPVVGWGGGRDGGRTGVGCSGAGGGRGPRRPPRPPGPCVGGAGPSADGDLVRTVPARRAASPGPAPVGGRGTGDRRGRAGQTTRGRGTTRAGEDDAAVQDHRGRDGPDHDHPPRGVPGPVADLPRSVHQSSQAPGCGAG